MELIPVTGRDTAPVMRACIDLPFVIRGAPYATLVQVRNGEIARVGTEDIPPERYRAFRRPGERDPAAFAGMRLKSAVGAKTGAVIGGPRGIDRYPGKCFPFLLRRVPVAGIEP